MPTTQPATFRALHRQPGGFIMPNAWDAGSAILMAAEGFGAIATTSAGIAFSLGKQDYQVSDPRLGVSREVMFERMAGIVDAVAIPVNGDLETGWGDRPEDVADTLRQAIAIGLAGGNIEDRMPGEGAVFYDEALAVERIAAGAQAVRAAGGGFVFTARTDVLQSKDATALSACIRRANLYLEAGADCIYPVGVTDAGTIALLTREIAGPLNIVAGLSGPMTPRAILAAGAQRVSLGGSIARATLGFIQRSIRELRETGTLEFAEGQIGPADLNRLFAEASK